MEKCKLLLSRFPTACIEYNAFESEQNSAESVMEQKLATRFYIVLFSIILILITTVAAVTVRSIHHTEYLISSVRFTELISTYPTTLKCPCSRSGIAYETFVDINVDFHPVCSSKFVTQKWIDSIYAQINVSPYLTNDTQYYLIYFWQAISSFCRVSNSTWLDTRSNFLRSQVISPVAIPYNIILQQAQAALHNSISVERTMLNRHLLAIRNTISGNQFISALATNFYLGYTSEDSFWYDRLKMLPKVYGNCSCLNAFGCPHPILINTSDGQNAIPIPGMIADCLIIDATLASTLECYYDSTCFSLLHGNSTNTDIELLLNISNVTFQTNSTMEMLIHKMMIDDVHLEVQFDLFYTQCNPTYCYFTENIRFSLIFIATTIISVFGGLSSFVKMLTPRLARLFLQRKGNKGKNDNKAHTIAGNRQNLLLRGRLIAPIVARKVVELLINLNIFESQSSSTGTQIRRQRILTRVFICLFLICLVSFGFYIFISERDHLITVDHPSYEMFEKLHENYSNTLQCMCTQTAVSHGTFVNVNFVLHQICSSELVSDAWINYLQLYDPNNLPISSETRLSRDFRSFGANYFQFVAMFCSLAKLNIDDAQNVFMSSILINAYLPQPFHFHKEVEDILTRYITKTSNEFLRLINWIKMANIVSRFLSGSNINFRAVVTDLSQVTIEGALYFDSPYVYPDIEYGLGECSCKINMESCKLRPIISTTTRIVSNELVIGCIPLVGLIKSSNNWWYNASFIESVKETYRNVIDLEFPPDIKPLNRTIVSRFEFDKFDTLLREMFLEIGRSDYIRYDLFYMQCLPSVCSYQISRQQEIFAGLLLLASVCGGLNRVLRLALPLIGKVIFILYDMWKNKKNKSSRCIIEVVY